MVGGCFIAARSTPLGVLHSAMSEMFRPSATMANLAPSQPFTMQFGPGRTSGTFNIEWVEDVDEMIKMINAMKAFLKTKEAAN